MLDPFVQIFCSKEIPFISYFFQCSSTIRYVALRWLEVALDHFLGFGQLEIEDLTLLTG